MSLDFLKDAGNVVLLGQNGTGKTTLAQNLAHQALVAGHTVLFTTAGHLLGDLSAIDSDTILRRRLRHYARPDLLVVDEVGYLSYSNRHADLMFDWCPAATSPAAPSSPTAPLPSGGRSFPTPPASSR